MAMSWLGSWFEQADEDMAKQGSRKASPVDTTLVGPYVDRLTAAGTDRSLFDQVLADLGADPSLRAGEVISIALGYAGRSQRITSKKKALEAISKRFVENVRFHAKNRIAEKARPW